MKKQEENTRKQEQQGTKGDETAQNIHKNTQKAAKSIKTKEKQHKRRRAKEEFPCKYDPKALKTLKISGKSLKNHENRLKIS